MTFKTCCLGHRSRDWPPYHACPLQTSHCSSVLLAMMAKVVTMCGDGDGDGNGDGDGDGDGDGIARFLAQVVSIFSLWEALSLRHSCGRNSRHQKESQSAMFRPRPAAQAMSAAFRRSTMPSLLKRGMHVAARPQQLWFSAKWATAGVLALAGAASAATVACSKKEKVYTSCELIGEGFGGEIWKARVRVVVQSNRLVMSAAV